MKPLYYSSGSICFVLKDKFYVVKLLKRDPPQNPLSPKLVLYKNPGLRLSINSQFSI